MNVPHEFAMGEVYLPPLFIAAILGAVSAGCTAWVFQHYRLSRLFYCPSQIVVALAVIYTGLISTFLIPG